MRGVSLTYDGQKPVGNYLLYPAVPGVRDRATVHAMAYIFRNMPTGYGTGVTRVASFATITGAKRWIERTAKALAS
jgi:tetrahydromethanopterin S-methyltransferase subunit B